LQHGQQCGCAKALLIQAIISNSLEQDLQDLKDLYRDAALGPSTEAIIKEAETKGVPGSPSALLYDSTGLRRQPKANAGNDEPSNQHSGCRTGLIKKAQTHPC